MAKVRLFPILFVIALLIPAMSCKDGKGDRQESVFKQVPELIELKPERPVKIKLKRNASGSYSWELSGSDTDKVLQADKKLKEALEK
jgi:predicted secreted protein